MTFMGRVGGLGEDFMTRSIFKKDDLLETYGNQMLHLMKRKRGPGSGIKYKAYV